MLQTIYQFLTGKLFFPKLWAGEQSSDVVLLDWNTSLEDTCHLNTQLCSSMTTSLIGFYFCDFELLTLTTLFPIWRNTLRFSILGEFGRLIDASWLLKMLGNLVQANL